MLVQSDIDDYKKKIATNVFLKKLSEKFLKKFSKKPTTKLHRMRLVVHCRNIALQ